MNSLRALTAMAAALALSACSGSTPAAADGCTALFGQPVPATGLTSEQCGPRCACGGTSWTPPSYDAAFVASLLADWTQVEPPAPLTSDPYLAEVPVDDPPDTVCAVVPLPSLVAGPRPYRVQTFASEALARAAGASPTHFGHCGVCSSLANLAVYVREVDLTEPVRTCGLQNASSFDGNVACLQRLGFELPCAQVWAYNTANTRSQCLTPCLANLTSAYHLPDGRLNDCILCDEQRSGPVFKAVAGRTRRNSGLPNALCRPCSEVRPLVHDYGVAR
jgi:hypothetical protein